MLTLKMSYGSKRGDCGWKKIVHTDVRTAQLDNWK